MFSIFVIKLEIMRFLFILVAFIGSLGAFSQSFADYFENKTLRLDYTFEGDHIHQTAALEAMKMIPEWNGRKVNPEKVLLQGNGQIQMYDAATDRLIYVESYSTLFQEWTTLEVAKKTQKKFENVFLVPFPKQKVNIKIVFFDKANTAHVLLNHFVDPKDTNIQKEPKKNEIETIIIHQSSHPNPIKIAVVAEGYSKKEMKTFKRKANAFVRQLFKHSAFKKYQERFQFIAVMPVSIDSGITTPRKQQWKNTALQASFDTFDMDRYLTIQHVREMHNVLEGIPYHHIVVLANSEVYGGGGIYNSYAVMSAQIKKFARVTVHEFGHSFAGLADEYFYPSDHLQQTTKNNFEPWEQNITSLANFETKWKRFLKKDTPIPTTYTEKNRPLGVYEGLKGNGIYIPGQVCRMKTNGAKDFCTVCSHAIEQLILFYTEE